MTAIETASRPLSEADHRAQLRRAVIASAVGTTIEWYDFFLYSQAAALVFGKLFFPRSDPLIGVMEAFTVFFVGYVTRPIGAAIFGHFGDRIGRKKTLVTTLLMTGFATFAVGLVPTYASIGIWGAVLLTILRLIQGVGVGGEWGGSVLLAMEWARTNAHRGFIAAWPQFGAPAGLLLATLAMLVFSAISGDQFLVWGWRIPFLLSIIMVGVGLYIRLRTLEPPSFRRLLAENRIERAPALEVIKRRPKLILLTAFAKMGGARARRHLSHVCLYLWADGAAQLARFPAHGPHHVADPVVPHDPNGRPLVGSLGPQAPVPPGRPPRRGLRLRVFHAAEHRSARLDVCCHRALLRSARPDVRSDGGVDRGMFPRPATL